MEHSDNKATTKTESAPLFSDARFLKIEDQVRNNLGKRLRNNQAYTAKEIADIEETDVSLFPVGYRISDEYCDNLRALAQLSQCRLKGLHLIKSHRPVVGRLIVACKKIVWRMLKANLDETFAALEEFCSRLLYQQAGMLLELQELRIAASSTSTGGTTADRTSASAL